MCNSAPKPRGGDIIPPMSLPRGLRLRDAKWMTQGHTALVLLAPGSVPSSWQMEGRGGEAEAGAGDGSWGGLCGH